MARQMINDCRKVDAFPLEPCRQEIDWRCQWRSIGWAYILLCAGGVAISIAAGSLPSVAGIGRAIAGGVGSVLLLGGVLLVAIPFFEYVVKALVARRMRERKLSLAFEEDQFCIYEKESRFMCVPRHQVSEVQVWEQGGDVAGSKCGVGFVLSNHEEAATGDASDFMASNFKVRGVHLWLASQEIGKRSQVGAMLEWLKDNGFADKIHAVQTPPETCLPWDRECWIILGVASVAIVLAIGASL